MMIKAIVSNDIGTSLSPPEIPPETNIFSQPALTKLAFFDKQLKWIMEQNINDSFKTKIYQDTLSKAAEVYKSITNKKTAEPVNVPKDTDFVESEKNQNQIESLKKEIEALKKRKKEKVVTFKHSPIAGRTKSKLKTIKKRTKSLAVYGGFKI